MKQLLRRKSFALAMGVLSVVLLILLAGSVDFLVLREGTPFSYLKAQEEQSAILLEAPDMTWIFVVVIAILLGLIIAAIIFATPKQRRRLIFALLLWALAFAGIMWWISRDREASSFPPMPIETAVQTPVPVETMLSPGTEDVPDALYEQPAVSPWVSIGITFVALLVGTLIVWLTLRHRLRDQVPLDALADIAAQAVDDLQAGMDYGDAVINCYANMVAALNKQRDIRRRGNLTPTEFIAVLERARLPSASIRRLTALFERVRYGGKKPLQAEIDEAVACLNEIIAAIREVQG